MNRATSSSAKADPQALALESYKQNFETFRSLNSLMWQIPLIGMTLTGGLWFGVSRVGDSFGISVGLLSLAVVGNVCLAVILQRLRYIMGQYLKWLEAVSPDGYVDAPGDSFFTRKERVKQVFQTILGFAALISFVLIYFSMPVSKTKTIPAPTAAAWYDAHAEKIADGYESLDANFVHPELFEMLNGAKPLRVLDVGAGTGRDATALARLGHNVTAVDPSSKMLQLARALHPNARVVWVQDRLPGLALEDGPYDLILLSAVWMHVPPSEREAAFDRLVQLLAPGGRLYATLRIGPEDPERGIYAVDATSLQLPAKAAGLTFRDLGHRIDLLGRPGVSWRSVLVEKAI